MMPNTLYKLRLNSYHQQNGLCIYCEKPMWLNDPRAFAKQHSIPSKQAKKFQCTAEHLIAKQDGGKDTAINIVAACHHCNQSRHRRKHPLDPIKFKSYVMRRVRKGKWNSDISSFRLPRHIEKRSSETILH